MSGAFAMDKMTAAEKLLAMEALWDDLCRQAGSIGSPAWHEDVLAEREARYRRGEESAEDWELAKRSIQDQLG